MASDWQNPGQPVDVNNDFHVSPLDALLGINILNDKGSFSLGTRNTETIEPFYDVNGDGDVSPIDVLVVVNALNDTRPVVVLGLENDTGPNGVANADRITFDPKIELKLALGGAAEIEVAFDEDAEFLAFGSDTQNSVLLDSETLDAAYGGPLPDGKHTLFVRARNPGGSAEPIEYIFTLDRQPPELSAVPSIDLIADGEIDASEVASILSSTLVGIIADEFDRNPSWSVGDLESIDFGQSTTALNVEDLAGNKATFQIDLNIRNRFANEAPRVVGQSSRNFQEGTTGTLAFDIEDDEQDVISWQLFGLPPFATIDDNALRPTAMLAPSHDDAGEYQVEVVLEDSLGAIETKTHTFRVHETNRVPQLTGVDDVAVRESINEVLVASFADPDDDPVQLDVRGLPEFASWFVRNDEVYLFVDANFDAARSVSLTIVASDGTDQTEQSVSAEFEPNIDDHGDTTDSATLISTLESFQAEINEQGDEDWFRFFAFAGTTYVIESSGVDNGDVSIAVTDESDTRILASSSSERPDQPARLFYRAEESGYRYLTTRSNYSETGRYEVDIQSISTWEPPRLTLDEKTEGTLESFGEVWYRIDSIAFERYTIAADNVTPVAIQFELFDSSGTEVLQWTSPDVGSYLARTDGPLFVRVAAAASDPAASGPFSLELVGESVNTPPVIAPITDREGFNDVSQFVSLDIDDAEGDVWSLSATTTEPQVAVDIRDPESIVITASEGFVGPAIIDVVVNDGQTTISEEFTFTFAARPPEHGDTADSATMLPLATATSGYFESRNALSLWDRDWFSFDATAGIVYAIEALPGSIGAVDAVLYADAGNTFLDADFFSTGRGGAAQIIFEPETTGRYFVKLEADERRSVGGYEVIVTPLADWNIPALAVDTQTDVDLPPRAQYWHRLDVSETGEYLISLSGDMANGVQLDLRDANGIEVLERSLGQPEIHFNGTARQSYFLTVMNDSTARSLRLDIENITPAADDHGTNIDDATLIAVGEALSFVSEASGDEDWFRFEAAADAAYVVQAIGAAPNDSSIALFDQTGEDLLRFDSGGGSGTDSFFVFNSEAATTYFVRGTSRDRDIANTLLIQPLAEWNLPRLQPGVEIDGELEGFEQRWFRFDAEASTRYTVESVAGTLADTRLTAYAADGKTLLDYNDNFEGAPAARLDLEIEEDGVVYIVAAVGIDTLGNDGTFALNLNATPNHPPTIAAISDRTLFNDLDRSEIPITITDADNDFLAVDVGSNRPDLVEASVFWGLDDPYIVLRPIDDADGTATITLTASDRFETTTRSFEVEVATRPDDHADDAGGATLIDVGVDNLIMVEKDGDEDWLRFDATAGQTYVVQAFAESFTSPKIRLYQSDGQSLIALDGGGGAGGDSLLVHKATATGTLFVNTYRDFSDFDATKTGSFTLRVDPVEDWGIPTLAGHARADGTIEAFEKRWLRINAVAGKQYTIETIAGTLTDTRMALYGSDADELIAFDQDSGNGLLSRIEYDASETRPLYLEVAADASDFGAEGTFSVLVRADDAPVNMPPTLDEIEDQVIFADQPHIDVPLTVSDSDGDPLTLSGDSSDPSVLVSIEGSNLRLNPIGAFVGTTEITVAADDGIEVVRRTFALTGEERPDDHGDSIDDATSISLNQDISVNVEHADDEDWLRFPAVEGETYIVETESLTLSDPTLALYRAADEQLLAIDDNGGPGKDARIVYRANVSGDVAIRAWSPFTSNTGTFNVRVSDSEQWELPQVEPGATTAGVLEQASADWYRVDFEANTTYVIETDSTDAFDSRLTIYESDGSSFLTTDTSSGPGTDARVIYRNEVAATRLIKVDSLDRTAEGEYNLTVTELSEWSLPTLDTEQPISGQIESRDAAWFRFEATAGTQYELETLAGTLDDTSLTLLDTDGETILFTDEDSGVGFLSRIRFEAERTDTYYVVVDAGYRDRSASGSFTLQAKANRPPNIVQLPEQQVFSDVGSIEIPLGITDPDDDSITLDAFADSSAMFANIVGSSLKVSIDEGFVGSSLVTVSANDGRGAATMQFPVSVAHRPDDFADTLDAAALLTVGQTQPGRIERPDDADVFKFEMVAGETYVAEVVPSGDVKVRLDLLDDSERRQSSDLGGGSGHSSRTIFHADRTESAYIRVAGTGRSDLGEYSLTVHRLADWTIPTLSPESPTDGVIERFESRWFRLPLAAGTKSTIRLAVEAGVSLSATLYESDGSTPLQHAQAGRPLEYLSSVDGVKYLKVQSTSGFEGERPFQVSVERTEALVERSVDAKELHGITTVIDDARGDVLHLRTSDSLIEIDPVSLSGEWTIAAWFRVVDQGSQTRVLASSAVGGSPIAVNADGEIGAFDEGGNFIGSGSFLPPLSRQWHHIAAVGSGATTTYYLDGEALGGIDQSFDHTIAYLGNRFGSSDRFAEFIDDARIYDQGLSASQVRDLATPNRLDMDSIVADAKTWLRLNGGAKPSFDAFRGDVIEFGEPASQVHIEPRELGATWTISAWFQGLSTESGSWKTLVRGRDGDSPIIVSPSGELGSFDAAGRTGFHGTGYIVEGTSADWHHVTAVGFAGQTEYYINGVRVGAASHQSTDVIAIIGNQPSGGQRFAAAVDEVRFFPQVVSELELRQLAARPNAAPIIQPIDDIVWNRTTATLRLPISAADSDSEDVGIHAESSHAAVDVRVEGGTTLVITPTESFDGTATISVQASDEFATTPISFHLSATGIVDDHANSAEGATPVNLGEPINVSIDSRGDQDWLRFDVEAGNTYVITAMAGTLSDPGIVLYDTDGQKFLTSDSDDGEGENARIIYRADKDASLFVAGQRDWRYRGDQRVGDFTVEINELASWNIATLEEDTTQVISIESYENRWLRLAGAVGRQIVINAQFSESGTAILYDEQGRSVLGLDPQELAFWPRVDSPLYLRLLSRSSVDGTVTVDLRTNTAPVIAPITDQHRTTEDGSFDIPLSIVDNESNSVTVTAATNAEGVTADIVDGDLIRITPTNDFSGKATIVVSATDSWAESQQSFEVRFSYRDDHGNDITTATELTIGQTVDAEVQEAGDRDWFRLDASAGQTYVFEVVGDTVTRPEMNLYEADGVTRIDTASANRANQTVHIIHHATEDATLFLATSSARFNETGSLSVSVDLVDDWLIPTLRPDVPVTGFVEGRTDAWFRVEAQAAELLILETTTALLTDTSLFLYGSDAVTRLAYDGDSGAGLGSRLEFTPIEDGPLYVRVTSGLSSIGSSGDFRILLVTNQPPRIEGAERIELLSGESTTAIVQVSDAEGDPLLISVESSDPRVTANLLPPPPLVENPSVQIRRVSLSAAVGFSGTATVTVIADDGSTTTRHSIDVAVTYDPPTIEAIDGLVLRRGWQRIVPLRITPDAIDDLVFTTAVGPWNEGQSGAWESIFQEVFLVDGGGSFTDQGDGIWNFEDGTAASIQYQEINRFDGRVYLFDPLAKRFVRLEYDRVSQRDLTDSGGNLQVERSGDSLVLSSEGTFVGEQSIALSISDGVQTAYSVFDVFVENRPPVFNLPDEIELLDTTARITLSAKDENFDAITYTLDEDFIPVFISASIDGDRLRIEPRDFFSTVPIDTTRFSLAVTASDGIVEATEQLRFHVTNRAPVIGAISNQILDVDPYYFYADDEASQAARKLEIPLSLSDPDGDEITAHANVYLRDQNWLARTNLQIIDSPSYVDGVAPYNFNLIGLEEKWLRSATGDHYFILPSGDIYRWEETPVQTFVEENLVAVVSEEAYADPRRVWNAVPRLFPSAAAGIVNGMLSVTVPPATIGSVQVEVAASDGKLRAIETFDITINEPDAGELALYEQFQTIVSEFEAELEQLATDSGELADGIASLSDLVNELTALRDQAAGQLKAEVITLIAEIESEQETFERRKSSIEAFETAQKAELEEKKTRLDALQSKFDRALFEWNLVVAAEESQSYAEIERLDDRGELEYLLTDLEFANDTAYDLQSVGPGISDVVVEYNARLARWEGIPFFSQSIHNFDHKIRKIVGVGGELYVLDNYLNVWRYEAEERSETDNPRRLWENVSIRGGSQALLSYAAANYFATGVGTFDFWWYQGLGILGRRFTDLWESDGKLIGEWDNGTFEYESPGKWNEIRQASLTQLTHPLVRAAEQLFAITQKLAQEARFETEEPWTEQARITDWTDPSRILYIHNPPPAGTIAAGYADGNVRKHRPFSNDDIVATPQRVFEMENGGRLVEFDFVNPPRLPSFQGQTWTWWYEYGPRTTLYDAQNAVNHYVVDETANNSEDVLHLVEESGVQRTKLEVGTDGVQYHHKVDEYADDSPYEAAEFASGNWLNQEIVALENGERFVSWGADGNRYWLRYSPKPDARDEFEHFVWLDTYHEIPTLRSATIESYALLYPSLEHDPSRSINTFTIGGHTVDFYPSKDEYLQLRGGVVESRHGDPYAKPYADQFDAVAATLYPIIEDYKSNLRRSYAEFEPESRRIRDREQAAVKAEEMRAEEELRSRKRNDIYLRALKDQKKHWQDEESRLQGIWDRRADDAEEDLDDLQHKYDDIETYLNIKNELLDLPPEQAAERAEDLPDIDETLLHGNEDEASFGLCGICNTAKDFVHDPVGTTKGGIDYYGQQASNIDATDIGFFVLSGGLSALLPPEVREKAKGYIEDRLDAVEDWRADAEEDFNNKLERFKEYYGPGVDRANTEATKARKAIGIREDEIELEVKIKSDGNLAEIAKQSGIDTDIVEGVREGDVGKALGPVGQAVLKGPELDGSLPTIDDLINNPVKIPRPAGLGTLPQIDLDSKTATGVILGGVLSGPVGSVIGGIAANNDQLPEWIQPIFEPAEDLIEQADEHITQPVIDALEDLFDPEQDWEITNLYGSAELLREQCRPPSGDPTYLPAGQVALCIDVNLDFDIPIDNTKDDFTAAVELTFSSGDFVETLPRFGVDHHGFRGDPPVLNYSAWPVGTEANPIAFEVVAEIFDNNGESDDIERFTWHLPIARPENSAPGAEQESTRLGKVEGAFNRGLFYDVSSTEAEETRGFKLPYVFDTASIVEAPDGKHVLRLDLVEINADTEVQVSLEEVDAADRSVVDKRREAAQIAFETKFRDWESELLRLRTIEDNYRAYISDLHKRTVREIVVKDEQGNDKKDEDGNFIYTNPPKAREYDSGRGFWRDTPVMRRNIERFWIEQQLGDREDITASEYVNNSHKFFWSDHQWDADGTDHTSKPSWSSVTNIDRQIVDHIAREPEYVDPANLPIIDPVTFTGAELLSSAADISFAVEAVKNSGKSYRIDVEVKRGGLESDSAHIASHRLQRHGATGKALLNQLSHTEKHSDATGFGLAGTTIAGTASRTLRHELSRSNISNFGVYSKLDSQAERTIIYSVFGQPMDLIAAYGSEDPRLKDVLEPVMLDTNGSFCPGACHELIPALAVRNKDASGQAITESVAIIAITSKLPLINKVIAKTLGTVIAYGSKPPNAYADLYRQWSEQNVMTQVDALEWASSAYRSADVKKGQVIQGLTVREIEDLPNGFRAIVLSTHDKSTTPIHDRRTVIAFAGTRFPELTGEALSEFLKDMYFGNGKVPLEFTPEQYHEATALVTRVVTDYGYQGGVISTVGHSLGGGLAAYAAGFHGIPGVGINGAPLNDTMTDKITAQNQGPIKFLNYVNSNDAIWRLPYMRLVGNQCVFDNGPWRPSGFIDGHSPSTMNPENASSCFRGWIEDGNEDGQNERPINQNVSDALNTLGTALGVVKPNEEFLDLLAKTEAEKFAVKLAINQFVLLEAVVDGYQIYVAEDPVRQTVLVAYQKIGDLVGEALCRPIGPLAAFCGAAGDILAGEIFDVIWPETHYDELLQWYESEPIAELNADEAYIQIRKAEFEAYAQNYIEHAPTDEEKNRRIERVNKDRDQVFADLNSFDWIPGGQ